MQQPAWYETFRAPGSGGAVTVLDFRARQLSEADWAAALAAEQREAAARPAALRAAEQAKYAVVDVPHATLLDGHRIPLIGLGTWKADKGQVREAVHCALQVGWQRSGYACAPPA